MPAVTVNEVVSNESKAKALLLPAVELVLVTVTEAASVTVVEVPTASTDSSKRPAASQLTYY